MSIRGATLIQTVLRSAGTKTRSIPRSTVTGSLRRRLRGCPFEPRLKGAFPAARMKTCTNPSSLLKSGARVLFPFTAD